jgi:hypothetical protein
MRKSERNRQHNGQAKKDKRVNIDLYKTKDWVTRNQLKSGVKSEAPEGYQFLRH